MQLFFFYFWQHAKIMWPKGKEKKKKVNATHIWNTADSSTLQSAQPRRLLMFPRMHIRNEPQWSGGQQQRFSVGACLGKERGCGRKTHNVNRTNKQWSSWVKLFKMWLSAQCQIEGWEAAPILLNDYHTAAFCKVWSFTTSLFVEIRNCINLFVIPIFVDSNNVLANKTWFIPRLIKTDVLLDLCDITVGWFWQQFGKSGQNIRSKRNTCLNLANSMNG